MAQRVPLPAGVVFDMDGTLLDTESAARAAFERAIQDLGFDYRAEVYHRCIGTSHARTQDILSGAYGPKYDHGALHSRWSERFVEHTQSHPIAVKPGVERVLEELSHRNVPMAVATSNRRSVCEQHLAEANLDRYFRHLVCADEAGQTKPAPDPYLLAVEKLGVVARLSWAVEDSSIGVRSAVTAGLRVFHVPDQAMHATQANKTHPQSTVLQRVDELLQFLRV